MFKWHIREAKSGSSLKIATYSHPQQSWRQNWEHLEDSKDVWRELQVKQEYDEVQIKERSDFALCYSNSQ